MSKVTSSKLLIAEHSSNLHNKTKLRSFIVYLHALTTLNSYSQKLIFCNSAHNRWRGVFYFLNRNVKDDAFQEQDQRSGFIRLNPNTV